MIRSVKIIKGSNTGKIITDDERFLEPFIIDGKGEWFDPEVNQVPNEPELVKELKEVGQTKELKKRGRKNKN
jgi:hypothetical protein